VFPPSARFTNFHYIQIGRFYDFHPFEARSWPRRGSVTYSSGLQETLEPGSLHIDEGEGRIVFVVRAHLKRSTRVFVLEIG
jgi:hypothetical protein